VQCTVDSNCTNAMRPYCQTTNNTCVQCIDDTQCTAPATCSTRGTCTGGGMDAGGGTRDGGGTTPDVGGGG
jgi:hypothetical protein